MYRPAIPCEDGDPPEGYVSKLIKTESLPYEYNEEVVNILERIDPEQERVIRPIKAEVACKGTNVNKNAKNAAIMSCPPLRSTFMKPENINASVLYQKNAGTTTLGKRIANEYTITYTPSPFVINALKQTLEIEDFLLSNGLTYLDIQYANIMVLEDGTVRLIDTAGIVPVRDEEKQTSRDFFILTLQDSKLSNGITPFQNGFPEETGLQVKKVSATRNVRNGRDTNAMIAAVTKEPMDPHVSGYAAPTLTEENVKYYNDLKRGREKKNNDSQETLSLFLGNENENENENGTPILVRPAASGGKRRGNRRSTRGLKKRKRSTKKVRRSR